jgi:alpha-tubulin suppressor-like RCC1 family protein
VLNLGSRFWAIPAKASRLKSDFAQLLIANGWWKSGISQHCSWGCSLIVLGVNPHSLEQSPMFISTARHNWLAQSQWEFSVALCSPKCGHYSMIVALLVAIGTRCLAVDTGRSWFSPNSMKSILKFSLIPPLLHALTSHAALTVTNIAAGNGANHSLFITSDGSLWTMGENNYGQLGDGSFNNTNLPQRIVTGGVTAIAGSGHTLFIKTNGSLWGMGWNYQGQLGDGHPTTTSPPYGIDLPEQILPSGVKAVSAGGQHSLIIKTNGSLWAMGFNTSGQLGDGTTATSAPFGASLPEQIVASNVVAIAAGASHSLFLKSDGSLWAMGANNNGQLGDGTFNNTNRPEEIVTNNVVAIAAGNNHSLFLKSDGSLWGMGYNVQGDLGIGNNVNTNQPQQIVPSGVTAIAAGFEHSLFIKSDGSLWGMGAASTGQLGGGTLIKTNRPEEIVDSGVTAVAGGSLHTLFIKSDGSLWALGYDAYGELGDGGKSQTAIPEQIFPAPLPPGSAVTKISAGYEHSLFIRSDGSLWAMGFNLTGQLGDGTAVYQSTNRPEQIIRNVTAMAAGFYHSLLVETNGSLWAMGYNNEGELGDGTSTTRRVPELIVSSNVTTVAAGQYHSLFIKSDGSLWAMGYNNVGQLGDGTTNDAHAPVQIVSSNVVAIAAGYVHSLFLKSDGSAWGMGSAGDSALGNGAGGDSYTNGPEQIIASNVVAIAAGSGYSLFLKSDGSVWATGIIDGGWLGDTNRPEQIVSSNVVAIAAGQYHNLFLKSDGSLWTVGVNIAGQLGDGSVNGTNNLEQIVSNKVVAISAGGEHSLFVKSDGSLWAMGWNNYGQLGDGFVGDSWTPEQIFPLPQPVLTASASSGTGLQFNGTSQFGGTFYLLAGTNIAQPSQWTPIWTNIVTVRGTNNFSVTLTNAVNPVGSQFYLLQSR